MKKYELLLEDNITIDDIKLYRIRCCRSFKSGYETINEGDLGGYIQSEDNLSHYGNSWVFSEARVFGKAEVNGDSQIFSNTNIHGDAKVSKTIVLGGDIYNS